MSSADWGYYFEGLIAGSDAAEYGTLRVVNPHPEGTPAHRAWEEGEFDGFTGADYPEQ